MKFFYQIFIQLFNFSVHVASLFNGKAGKFVRGRRGLLRELSTKLSGLQTADSTLIWFHCASLGEFEQARPLIDKLRTQKSSNKILITFFSPSGYEVRKNYEGADFVFYLPVDTRLNVKRFLDIVNPSLVFFVKYDFWYNYLNELNGRKIPTYLVSANFRQEQFKGLYGSYLRTVLSFFNKIFVQNESSKNILAEQKILNVSVVGDLRYDKVAETALKPKKMALVHHFKVDRKIIICGSTWPQDEAIIVNGKLPLANWKLIIAPHEVDEPHILGLLKLFPDALRYSVVSKEPATAALDKLEAANVLIIDNIGMLSNLYQYADIAYIGGGFGAGIHNILEAVAFGVPVIFGPNHNKFPEGGEIIEQGGGFSISNANDLQKAINLLLSDEKILKMASMTCRNFVQGRKGTTEKIMTAVINLT